MNDKYEYTEKESYDLFFVLHNPWKFKTSVVRQCATTLCDRYKILKNAISKIETEMQDVSFYCGHPEYQSESIERIINILEEIK